MTVRTPCGTMWASGSLMGRLDDETRDSLTCLGRSRRFFAGEALLLQGAQGRHLYLLLAGIVKVSASTANGRTVLLSVRGAGETVGELAAADGAARTATVTACGEVTTREITGHQWQHFLEDNSLAYAALNAVIGERLRVATQRRIELGEHGTAVRIARFLCDFFERFGRDEPEGRRLVIPLSQVEIAAAAECSIASVQSALRELRQQGVLRTRYRNLVVLDRQELARRAGL